MNLSLSKSIVTPRKVGGSAFSPGDVTGLQIWLEADASVSGLSDGDKTGTPVTDLSGVGNNGIQATGTKQATWRDGTTTAGPNSKAFFEFDTTDDHYEFTDHSSIDFSSMSAFHIFSVFYINSGDPVDTAVFSKRTGGNGLICWVVTGNYSMWVNGASRVSSAYTLDTWQLVEYIWDGTNTEIAVNGSVTTAAYGTAPSTGTEKAFYCTYGSGDSATQFEDVDSPLLLVYNKEVTGSDLTSLRNHIGDKYGITIS